MGGGGHNKAAVHIRYYGHLHTTILLVLLVFLLLAGSSVVHGRSSVDVQSSDGFYPALCCGRWWFCFFALEALFLCPVVGVAAKSCRRQTHGSGASPLCAQGDVLHTRRRLPEGMPPSEGGAVPFGLRPDRRGDTHVIAASPRVPKATGVVAADELSLQRGHGYAAISFQITPTRDVAWTVVPH